MRARNRVKECPQGVIHVFFEIRRGVNILHEETPIVFQCSMKISQNDVRVSLIVDGVEGEDQIESLDVIDIRCIFDDELNVLQTLTLSIGIAHADCFLGKVVSREATLWKQSGELRDGTTCSTADIENFDARFQTVDKTWFERKNGALQHCSDGLITFLCHDVMKPVIGAIGHAFASFEGFEDLSFNCSQDRHPLPIEAKFCGTAARVRQAADDKGKW